MTSTPAIELKPCPFCGSPAQSTQWTGRMADDCFPHYSIHCTNGEDCWGSNHANLGSDLAETVAAWNRRSLDSADGVEPFGWVDDKSGCFYTHVKDETSLTPVFLASRPACTAEVVVKAEPVAWEGYWPGAGSINSQTVLTRFRSTMRRWEKDGAEITPLYASPPSPAQSAIVPPVVEVTEEMVKLATIEYLTHKGENPTRVTHGGWEFWESSTDAMRSALLAALQAQHRGD